MVAQKKLAEHRLQGTQDGPLSGVRVVEVGTLIAGPFAGRLLGDLGADVIKVENPNAPDPLREWGSLDSQGRSIWWAIQSRNKRCVTIDLRNDRGRQLFLCLAEEVDVIIENFRPGTMEAWGLSYDDLSAKNPGLIFTRISGYGQSGPYRSRPGFASVAEAMSGLRFLNGYPGEPPPRMGLSIGDSLASLFAVQGTLAALHWRQSSGGSGQVVDVSLLESCFSMLESVVPDYGLLGKVRGPSGTGLTNIAPSNLFRSRDDKWVVIAANNDGMFRRLCLAIERPDLIDLPRFQSHRDRGVNGEELDGIIAEWARQHDAKDIDATLSSRGVACGPIYSIAEVFEDPHFWHREMLLEHHDPDIGPFVGPGICPKFSLTPGRVRWTGPQLPGSHTADVLGGLLGLSDKEISDLRLHRIT